jgi:hypothetical protein
MGVSSGRASRVESTCAILAYAKLGAKGDSQSYAHTTSYARDLHLTRHDRHRHQIKVEIYSGEGCKTNEGLQNQWQGGEQRVSATAVIHASCKCGDAASTIITEHEVNVKHTRRATLCS